MEQDFKWFYNELWVSLISEEKKKQKKKEKSLFFLSEIYETHNSL